MTNQHVTTYLSGIQIAIRYRINQETVWVWAAEYPDFPKPVELSKGSICWKLTELEAWEAKKGIVIASHNNYIPNNVASKTHLHTPNCIQKYSIGWRGALSAGNSNFRINGTYDTPASGRRLKRLIKRAANKVGVRHE
jgi:predicted DNA-binding transcriptional regulator AlpA